MRWRQENGIVDDEEEEEDVDGEDEDSKKEFWGRRRISNTLGRK